ncbi:DoxX family protein [Chitinophaga nivalis]|uniref:DoxX family protein n=1 Tax=Chitinophaga nivalis TaxID=2991709 RepID=A0ABT3IS82_9BACT|nr:DoxX family protein [Chitinophaga nivalis]MCW3463481.1 DoxX family protein [Chitinophaga nivalis]MCW3486829.1 DoxX family protein [Chitinophaga nivalis]
MKKNKIIFWITTGLISIMMLFSALSYLTNPEIKQGFHHLGFPDYFRIELAVAKILGTLVLIIPAVPKQLKEFAYAGFGFTFISAAIAHFSSGDPTSVVTAPFLFIILLVVSYIHYHKLLLAKQHSLPQQKLA